MFPNNPMQLEVRLKTKKYNLNMIPVLASISLSLRISALFRISSVAAFVYAGAKILTPIVCL